MKRYKRSSMKHILAAALFCLTLGMGTVCHADEKGTVIVASAKIRAAADTSSEQIGSASEGKTVDIISETTGSDGSIWYQVYVDADTKGFIKGDLIRKEGGADNTVSTTTTATQTPTDLPETVVTPVEARKAAVKPDKATVRKGAGTSYARVGTANRGTVVTVTGEATASDGAKWYQISIIHQNEENIGFIRADLVSFDDIPEDVATSEIVGAGSGENEAGQENPEQQPQEPEPQPEEPPQEPEPAQPTATQSVTLMDGGKLSYVMPGFEEITMNMNEEKFDAYQNGTFYIIYGQDQSGEVGWFLFDSERQTYQRYAYAIEGVAAGGSALGGGLLPMIVLVIVIVILLAVIGLMFLKLREYKEDYGEYEDDEEDYAEDDDIEDLEEEEEYYEEELPVRRQRPQPQRLEPSRRPQPQADGGQQPGGRPQPQGNGGQPPRGQQRMTGQQPGGRPQPQGSGQQPGGRPQPQGNGGQPPRGQQQMSRRPQPQGNGQQPGGRPQPQGNSGQQPGGRPQPQGNGGQPPRGQQRMAGQQPQGNGGQPPRGQQRMTGQQPAGGAGQAPRPNNRPPQGGQPRPAQQGAKARPILDSEKEDMEFIDI